MGIWITNLSDIQVVKIFHHWMVHYLNGVLNREKIVCYSDHCLNNWHYQASEYRTNMSRYLDAIWQLQSRSEYWTSYKPDIFDVWFSNGRNISLDHFICKEKNMFINKTVKASSSHSNTGPFKNRTKVNHVRFLDPHCTGHLNWEVVCYSDVSLIHVSTVLTVVWYS